MINLYLSQCLKLWKSYRKRILRRQQQRTKLKAFVCQKFRIFPWKNKRARKLYWNFSDIQYQVIYIKESFRNCFGKEISIYFHFHSPLTVALSQTNKTSWHFPDNVLQPISFLLTVKPKKPRISSRIFNLDFHIINDKLHAKWGGRHVFTSGALGEKGGSIFCLAKVELKKCFPGGWRGKTILLIRSVGVPHGAVEWKIT